jgi:hypothetical protein
MVSGRQTAANRLNAHKSTGPNSPAGKKRASRNAYRHGLSLRISSAAETQNIEKLARKIASPAVDEITLEFARTAAEAELELARVRQVRIAMIQRVSAFGTLEQPDPLTMFDREFRNLKSRLSRRVSKFLPGVVDPLATMPDKEPERSAEAVRRLLPELLKLERYERRAVTRRDRALREVLSRSTSFKDQSQVEC